MGVREVIKGKQSMCLPYSGYVYVITKGGEGLPLEIEEI